MFTTLVESRAVRQRSVSGTITSLLLHAAAIGAAVAFTVTGTTQATEPPPYKPVIFTPVHPAVVRAVRPHTPSTPTPAPVITAPTRMIIAPVDIPIGIPPVEIGATPITDGDRIVIGPGLPSGTGTVGPSLGLPSGGVVDESAVERAPQLIGNAPTPRYPNALRESGIAGRVVLRFVIDTLGRAEMDGIIPMEASHPQFTDAVKSVLPLYRFRAGEVGGRKVRTLVQMPFVFSLR